jgi:hypothetical protein
MGDKTRICISRWQNGKVELSKEFEGRIIGFIDEEETKAILNTKDAARKLSTAETYSLTGSTVTVRDKRIVIVMKDKDSIFISPQIRSSGYYAGKKRYSLRDSTFLELEEI